MKVTVSVFGPEVTLKQEIVLNGSFLPLQDFFRSLLQRQGEKWGRILKEDAVLAKGYEVLVNGRNVKSLQGMATEIHEGDEIVFTVLLSGG